MSELKSKKANCEVYFAIIWNHTGAGIDYYSV